MYSKMKNILILLFFPLFLFSQSKGSSFIEIKNPPIIEIDERLYDVTSNLGWKVETGWKTVCNGKDTSCTDHQWLNLNKEVGDFMTKSCKIGYATCDMLQECKACVKCKRMETQLTFIGQGLNPFVWETTLVIYKQIIETSDKK